LTHANTHRNADGLAWYRRSSQLVKRHFAHTFSLEIKRKDALTSELEADLTLSLWASTLRSNVATSVVPHGG
jgi:hypothetical protein